MRRTARRPLQCIVPSFVAERMIDSSNSEVRQAGIRILKAGERIRATRELIADMDGAVPDGSDRKMRLIYDASGGGELPGTLIRKERGKADEAVPAANDVYDGMGDTYDFFFKVFKRKSFDGEGAPLIASVEVTQDGESMSNAFWNGDQMAFGDGDGTVFKRFTRSLEVIGHELTHAVIQHTSQLEYSGQPGALNEHFADVFGVLLRHWKNRADPAAQEDWTIGADVIVQTQTTRWAIRNMAKPGDAFWKDPYMGNDLQVGHMRDFYAGPKDSQGVHINSGIPNKAFVLFAKSVGENTWGAAGGIWYALMTSKDLKPDSQFQDCANVSIDITEAERPDLVDKLKEAWSGVGIEV